jgi:hypothetical protein
VGGSTGGGKGVGDRCVSSVGSSSVLTGSTLVVRERLVLVVPEVRVPEGAPLVRVGGVVSAGGGGGVPPAPVFSSAPISQ